MASTDIDRLSIDTIRTLSMDGVQAANSGHPGLPMAMAPVAYLLFARVMEHNPAEPSWPDRDRFILSAGHGSMLLYSALHLSGYDLPLDELKNFRQWGSLTPGHPERDRVHITPGVEITTGPLGQGFANGVGMAMAPAAYLLYTRILEHNPTDPTWPDRDRFILSAGHGSMLLYSVLHLSGYALSMDEIKRFRQWGSLTPGHPERDRVHVTPGVEMTTGPLGQGFANGVGMAMAERFLRAHFGAEVQDHRIFAIVSDGDLMEGIAAEAASQTSTLRRPTARRRTAARRRAARGRPGDPAASR